MTTFSYWLQHADFSKEDGTPVDRQTAKAAFTAHDWDAELRAAKSLVEAGAEQVCPPTICFISDADADDLALHIRPLDWSTAEIQYCFPVSKPPLLGFIPRASTVEERSASGVAIDSVGDAIDLFIDGRHAELLAFLLRAQR